ncbi:MAG: histidine phosphatase family protein [Taibaiella sp.]|nr:histidine phosphatase family protein [Taibaiella sp.]
MSKKVYIMRHAKTEDAFLADKPDFQRNLTERGKSDAAMIAERFRGKHPSPELIIASTAIRAADTAKIVAGATGYAEEKILWDKDLYLCEASKIDQVISGISGDYTTVLIIAHNFGITDFINHKIEDFFTDNLPTAGIACFELPITSWNQNHGQLKGKKIYLDYPKRKIQ